MMAEEIVDMLSKAIEHIKETQTKLLELESTISEMKDTQDGIDSRLETAERNISKTINVVMETI